MEDIFEDYFDIRRKISRKTFFYRSLKLFGIFIIGMFITIFIGMKYNITTNDTLGKIMAYGLIVVYFASMLSLSIRRLSDTNQSKWWSILILIPYLNVPVFFIFIFLKSQEQNSLS